MADQQENQLVNAGEGAGGGNGAGALTAAQQQEHDRLIAALNATGINANNFKAPMFWKSSPRTWFNRLESAFMSSNICLLYTSPSPRDKRQSRMPSSA